MVFILYGCSLHYAHIWNKLDTYFDLFKAFACIERVVKSNFFKEIAVFYIIQAHHVLSYHLTSFSWGLFLLFFLSIETDCVVSYI